MGWARGPLSSVNWAMRSAITSSMRFTGRLFMSLLNSCRRQVQAKSRCGFRAMLVAAPCHCNSLRILQGAHNLLPNLLDMTARTSQQHVHVDVLACCGTWCRVSAPGPRDHQQIG